MAALLNSVKVATATTGTGTVTLGAAEAGYLTVAEAGGVDGTVYAYRLDDGNDFEVGQGTYTASGTTLSRDTVTVSKISGTAGTTKLTLSGTATVTIVPRVADLVNVNGSANTIAFAAGTTSIAPITLASGTNLTTATAGAVEYNGATALFTPIGTQRGVIAGMQTFRLNSGLAGSNATGAQKTFGKDITLSSSTQYRFRIFALLTKSAGTTSHTVSILFGGTATLNNILYIANYGVNAGAAPFGTTGNTAIVATASAQAISGALTSASMSSLHWIEGSVSINSGGTFIPQYQLSAAPGGAYTTIAGSFMEIWPVAASGSDVNVGTWA